MIIMYCFDEEGCKILAQLFFKLLLLMGKLQ
jgi:hypothetical protein